MLRASVGAIGLILVGCGDDDSPGEAESAADQDALAQPADGAGTPPQRLAVVDTTVIPMDTDRTLDHHTVLVEGDRITALAPTASFTVPDDATQIDGRGRYLMPGLADMHIHAPKSLDDTLFLGHGVTTTRVMWGSLSTLLRRRRIRDGAIDGPTIYTAGPILDGDPPVWLGSAVPATPAEARQVVRNHLDISLGRSGEVDSFDFVKVYNGLQPEIYQAIIDEAATVGLPVVGHVPFDVGLFDALAAGQDSIEHLYGYWQVAFGFQSPIHLEVSPAEALRRFDSAALRRAAEATVEAGTWNCPTYAVFKSFAFNEDEARTFLERPQMRYVWDSQRRAWASQSAGQPEIAEMFETIVAALHDAGARLLVGSDQPSLLVVPGVSVHDELADLVRIGLSPFAALRAATSGAADFLGMPEEFGRIQVGARADLILLRANPLQDIAQIAQLDGVMVRGRWLDSTALETMLEPLVDAWVSTR